ncbi:MAG: hypothetical protein ABJC13_08545 [Acidobacteriota bacterium]
MKRYATLMLLAGLLAGCGTAGRSRGPLPVTAAPTPSQSNVGLSRETAIEVCEPAGEKAYLARLCCPDGAVPTYERSGSVGLRNAVDTKSEEELARQQMLEERPIAPGEADYHVVDLYDVICSDKEYGIFLDMYHCGQPEPKAAPADFSIAGRNAAWRRGGFLSYF